MVMQYQAKCDMTKKTKKIFLYNCTNTSRSSCLKWIPLAKG
jgi:hypothetical protein